MIHGCDRDRCSLSSLKTSLCLGYAYSKVQVTLPPGPIQVGPERLYRKMSYSKKKLSVAQGYTSLQLPFQFYKCFIFSSLFLPDHHKLEQWLNILLAYLANHCDHMAMPLSILLVNALCSKVLLWGATSTCRTLSLATQITNMSIYLYLLQYWESKRHKSSIVLFITFSRRQKLGSSHHLA